jgi:hypothetical protein
MCPVACPDQPRKAVWKAVANSIALVKFSRL